MRRLSTHEKAELVGDAHVYGGALLVALGAGFVHPPLGPIVFGAFACFLGLFWRGRKA